MSPPMPNAEMSYAAKTGPGRLLSLTGKIWFAAALAGQAVFIAFIITYYGRRTATGDFAAWNDRGLITGHVSGDTVGNTVFAIHVLLAAYITFGGLCQLIPALRRRFPAAHRWNGRAFIVTAAIMAVSGLWMTWGRGSYLSVISGVSVSLNGVLILVFAGLALSFAMQRRIDIHRRWAMRTFMVVSGVWFFRVGLMAWIVLNQGPVGMNNTLSGPADIALSFGSYLIPLTGLEIYLAAQNSSSGGVKLAVSGLVLCLTAVMAVGIFGAAVFMWFPQA
ncbi:MAG: DUF2306 domain-containing protein [Euryhalocaulis sp.]|nr:DUF2306 domain-containing protein [Euryhalocaulis sp.]